MVFSSQLADSIPSSEHRDLVSNFFWSQLDKFSQRTLFVHYESGRQFTGSQIKRLASRCARRLLWLLKLEAEFDCMLVASNNADTLIASLAVLFAGGSVCVYEPEDPEDEQAYHMGLVRPRLVFVVARLVARMLTLRAKLGLEFKLVVVDDHELEGAQQVGALPGGEQILGLHGHLFADQSKREPDSEPAPELPVQVSPERAAFVLFTSGSTGRAKAVARTQRNCLYVCHCLPERTAGHLWTLNERSVLSGHLPLDHGTGTFCLKMALAKGLKLIVMERFEAAKLAAAIERHGISDAIVGSALLHNFITEQLEQGRKHELSSLANLIATGSPIVSFETAGEFCRAHPNCSIRQAFGMTECGFISMVERGASAEQQAEARTVGQLLPNVKVKLIERRRDGLDYGSARELLQPACTGELCVAAPTRAKGYLDNAEATERAFMPDGFYLSSDLAELHEDELEVRRLRIKGRLGDVLLLYDGWKVLPADIEHVVQQHASVHEAAVVGVPHPELASCHAPRAYVVLKRAVAQQAGLDRELVARQIAQFVAERVAEPKRLLGGVKVVDSLPRVSIGKVDRRLLKQQDGFA